MSMTSLKEIRVLADRLPFYENGKLAGAVSIFRNRTEVARLADDLTGVRHMVDAMRAYTHEFMNKLHVILGLLQIGEPEKAQAYIMDTTRTQREAVSRIMHQIREPSVAALLVAVVALSLKGREAVPAQGSPAESGMSYYTPKASASQGSAAQPAGDGDGPYRVAVYDGKIGVFRQGETEPFLTADVEVYLLPQEDIALLRAGLEADTLAEVKAILEDYQ